MFVGKLCWSRSTAEIKAKPGSHFLRPRNIDKSQLTFSVLQKSLWNWAHIFHQTEKLAKLWPHFLTFGNSSQDFFFSHSFWILFKNRFSESKKLSEVTHQLSDHLWVPTSSGTCHVRFLLFHVRFLFCHVIRHQTLTKPMSLHVITRWSTSSDISIRQLTSLHIRWH